MGQPSSIATHPQRDKIIAALVAEQSYRTIASWAQPAVTIGSLSRFKRNAISDLGGTVAKQVRRQAERDGTAAIYDTGEVIQGTGAETRAAMMATASPFRSRLDRIWNMAERTLDKIESSDEGLAAAPAMINAAMRTVEVLGRATGELDSGPNIQNNTQIVLNVPRGDR